MFLFVEHIVEQEEWDRRSGLAIFMEQQIGRFDIIRSALYPFVGPLDAKSE